MPGPRDFLKRTLPTPVVEWIRRRKALRTYLRELAHEIYYSNTSVDSEEMEGLIAARRDGAYGRLLKDVLDRTDLVFQELDRRMEGTSVRTAEELQKLREEMRQIRALLEELRSREAGPAEDATAAVRGAGD